MGFTRWPLISQQIEEDCLRSSSTPRNWLNAPAVAYHQRVVFVWKANQFTTMANSSVCDIVEKSFRGPDTCLAKVLTRSSSSIFPYQPTVLSFLLNHKKTSMIQQILVINKPLIENLKVYAVGSALWKSVIFKSIVSTRDLSGPVRISSLSAIRLSREPRFIRSLAAYWKSSFCWLTQCSLWRLLMFPASATAYPSNLSSHPWHFRGLGSRYLE